MLSAMENDRFHAFADYCALNGLSEAEGRRGALHLHVPSTRQSNGYWIYHTPEEIRAFSRLTLSAVFALTDQGIAALMERVDQAERAHALWLAT